MESFVFISDYLNHDAHAVHHFQVMAVNALKARGMIFTKVIQFSDGCGAQYKGRTNFVDVSHAAEDTGVPTEKHFFGSRHGKGPCDAEIGIVKRMVSSAVKARRAVVSNANKLSTTARHLSPGHQHLMYTATAAGCSSLWAAMEMWIATDPTG